MGKTASSFLGQGKLTYFLHSCAEMRLKWTSCFFPLPLSHTLSLLLFPLASLFQRNGFVLGQTALFGYLRPSFFLLPPFSAGVKLFGSSFPPPPLVACLTGAWLLGHRTTWEDPVGGGRGEVSEQWWWHTERQLWEPFLFTWLNFNLVPILEE